MLGERCNDTNTSSCWIAGVVGPLPALVVPRGVQVVWLQSNLSKPFKSHQIQVGHQAKSLRVLIYFTSWLVVYLFYPVVYDLFHTSFLVIEMPMIPFWDLPETPEFWAIKTNKPCLSYVGR